MPLVGGALMGGGGTAGVGTPAQVTGLTHGLLTVTRVDLTWDAAQRAASYEVERDGSIIATGVSGTAYSDTTVAPLTSYSYRVRGRNGGGAGGWSDAHNVTTPGI